VDGDGKMDACLRTPTGVRCAYGDVLSAEAHLPGLSDAAGWDAPTSYSTLRARGLDGDGRADLCARASTGVVCWRSVNAPLDVAGSAPDDPKLAPNSADAIVALNVWHHVGAREAYAAKRHEALKPSGVFVVVDFLPEQTEGFGPPLKMRLSAARVRRRSSRPPVSPPHSSRRPCPDTTWGAE
jgi:SAM-dependent methyltransferase